MENLPPTGPSSDTEFVPKPWAPFLMAGATLCCWRRVLAGRWGRVHWACWPALLLGLGFAVIRVGSEALQRRKYRREIAPLPLSAPPIFVIGHWRTGTTMLHELLALDPRHTAPTTGECFFPTGVLTLVPFLRRVFGLNQLRPRPMDAMKTGFNTPAEEEFALWLLGLPSLTGGMCFPNGPAPGEDLLDVRKLSATELAEWKAALLQFVQQVHHLRPRRVVLKSPGHSARIEVLLELFPGAKFVQIIRHPFEVFASARKLGRTLVPLFTLEKTTLPDSDGVIFDGINFLHRRAEEARPKIPAGQFHRVRYEDLVRQPMEELRRVYEALELGDFEPARPAMEKYFSERADHQAGRYVFSEAEQARMRQRLETVMKEQGYE